MAGRWDPSCWLDIDSRARGQAGDRHDRGRPRPREGTGAFAPLGELDYEYAPHRPRTHHFAKPAADPCGAHTHGLHLTEPGSDLWIERLAFRDALRADPGLAAEYEALKLGLASGAAAGYTVAKRPFVARVLAAAGIEIPPVGPR